tara:strand:+ start:1016 stop:1570 length:555 start_codon:yes stop_codon:yes gene_type:complete
MNFFGFLSKKNKLKANLVSEIYVNTLDSVIEEGFDEIKDFINNNNNLEGNANLTKADIDWFRNIIFLGNIQNLQSYFEEHDSTKLRGMILDIMYKDLDQNKQNLAIERFLDYENYFNDLLSENSDVQNAMAYGIFEKYNLNKYQGQLFKRKNKPNPIFLNELKGLLKLFLWNWDDYLEKNKIIF